MRFLAFLLLFGVLLAGPVRADSQPRFFESLYDVPIMPGLQEAPNYALVFDTPDGRVAEAAALISPGMPDQTVNDFYARVLPQLGWQVQPSGRYFRASDELVLDLKDQGGQRLLHLTLGPR